MFRERLKWVGCIMLVAFVWIYVRQYTHLVSNADTSENRVSDTTIYESMIESKFNETDTSSGLAFGVSMGSGLYMPIGGGSSTSFHVVIDSQDHMISKDDWIHLNDGDTIRYQKTDAGKIVNVILLDDGQSPIAEQTKGIQSSEDTKETPTGKETKKELKD